MRWSLSANTRPFELPRTTSVNSKLTVRLCSHGAQRFRNICSIKYSVAELDQDVPSVFPHAVIVFDHQNRLTRPGAWQCLALHHPTQPASRLDLRRAEMARQINLHGRAAAFLAIDAYVASRLFDKTVHH